MGVPKTAKWWCVNCPTNGTDFGPFNDRSKEWDAIAKLHLYHPGWGTTQPNNAAQQMEKKTRQLINKNAKIRIGFDEENGEMTRADYAYMLAADNKFVTLDDTEVILYYENGCYHHGAEGMIKRMCESMIADCTNTDVKEIIGTIQRKERRKRSEFDLDEFMICVKNCNIDLRTGQISEHSPELYFRSQLPVAYDRSARCPKFVSFLHQCLPDPNDYIDQLEAFACGLLRGSPKLEAMFFETGKGDNGKSTFLNIINWFYGQDNISTVSIHELILNRFAKARLENKMINTFPDIESDALENFGVLKALVSGDAIDAEFKYQNPHTFVCHAKLFFSANELPEIREKTFATFKRIRLTKWTQQFFKSSEYQLHYDMLRAKMPNHTHEQLVDELALAGIRRMNRQFVNSILSDEREKSGILNLLLTVVRNIIKRDGFFNDYTHDQLKDLWSENSTMIEAFCRDCLVRKTDRYLVKTTVFQGYHAYCRLNNKPAKQDNVVHPIIQALFNIESSFRKVSGRNVRVYEGLDWNENHPISVRFAKSRPLDTGDTGVADNLSKQMRLDPIIKRLSEKPVSHASNINSGMQKYEGFADD